MPSERVQRRIDRLLDQADEAAETLDWPRVDEIARSVLNIDPENEDATAFLGLAEPHLGGGSSSASVPAIPAGEGGGVAANPDPSRTSGHAESVGVLL